MVKSFRSIYFPVVIFLSSFLYFYFIVDPTLIYFNQGPLFFFDFYSVNSYLDFPGGIIQMLSLFISQLYKYRLFASIGLSLLFLLLFLLGNYLSAKLRLTIYANLILLIGMLLLFLNYNFPLYSLFGIIFALAFSILFIKISILKGYLKYPLLLILFLIAYYLVCSYALLSVLIWFVKTVLGKPYRQILFDILGLIIACIIPYLSHHFVFPIPLTKLYLNLLPLHTAWWVKILPLIHLGIFPAAMIINHFVRYKLQNVLYPVVLAIIFIYSLSTYKQDAKTTIRINKYSYHHNWDKVIELGDYWISKGFDKEINTVTAYLHATLVKTQLSRALYHKDLLTEKLFSYKQVFGNQGLICNELLHSKTSLAIADIYLDMKYYNACKKYVYESISTEENNPFNLNVLARASILSGNFHEAKKSISILDKSIVHRKEARELKEMYHKYSSYNSDTEQYSNLSSDYFMNLETVEWDLWKFLGDNPENKMAFEYLMMNNLLENSLGSFVYNLPLLNNFNYSSIPIHFQEAILIYNGLVRDQSPVDLNEYPVSRQMISNFIIFRDIMRNYQHNSRMLETKLKENFSESFWYYTMFPPQKMKSND